jgi:diguanylate cyclase (GGDEF)-like protein
MISISKTRMSSKSLLILTSCILVPIVGYLDFLTGSQLSLFILYVGPVSLATYRAGRLAGMLIAFESAVVWYLTDTAGHRIYSHPLFPVWNAIARFALLVAIASFQGLWARERVFARTDFLTGLANRADFFESAKRELYRARRYRHPLSVCYFDIDDFKLVNDRLGHETGDKLLQLLGKTIQGSIRSSDLAARLGGDEFALLLPHTEGAAARALVEKLHELLLVVMRNEGWAVDFSFGVATFLSPPNTADELTRKADELMYAAKMAGKGTIRQELFG